MGCSSSSPAAVPPPAANRGAGGSSGTPSGGTGGAKKDAAVPISPKAEDGNDKKPAPPSAASKLLGLAAFDDPSGDEPSVPVAVGKRRGSQANLTPPPQSAGPAATARGPGGTLPRMESSKNVSLGVGGGTPAGEEGAGSGGAEQGNFMQNIHSSPFQATLAFEAPVYQKSDEDVEFV